MNENLENQTRCFGKLLEQQERQNQIMERLLDTQNWFITNVQPSGRISKNPAGLDQNSNVQFHHCQD